MLFIPGRIPIRIYPFFWLLAFIIGWLNSFSEATSLGMSFAKTGLWVVVITISVLVHEYGHALSAIAFGHRAQIDLLGFGGLTRRNGPTLNLWKEFTIVLAGPVFGLVLALFSYLLLEKWGNKAPYLLAYALNISFYVNLFWTLVNLLPVQPLDGGKLFSIILESIFGVRGIKIAYFVSIIVAAAIGVFFFTFQAVLAGALFFILAFESYRTWQSSLMMKEQDQNKDAQSLFQQAEQAMNEGRKEQAMVDLQNVREMTKSGVLFNSSSHYLATLMTEKGHYKEAYQILLPLKKKLGISAWQLLQQLAYRNHDCDMAIKLGDELFKEAPNYETAFINALCYGEKGEAKPAIGWLSSAVRRGMPHALAMLSKTEFDPIRQTPEFIQFKASLNKS